MSRTATLHRFIGMTVFVVAYFVMTSAPALGQGPPDIAWMRGGVTSFVTSAAYTPDGDYFATMGSDNVKIWRAADWMLMRTIDVSPNAPTAIAVWGTPAGLFRAIAIGVSNRTIQIRNFDTGDLDHTISGLGANATQLAWRSSLYNFNGNVFSPMLASTGDVTRLWNGTDGSLYFTYPAQAGGVLAFSHDGDRIAMNVTSGSSTNLAVYQVGANVKIAEFAGDSAAGLGFSPGDTMLARSNGAGVRVYDLSSKKSVFNATGFGSTSVTFSPDGQRLAAGAFPNPNGQISFFLWDTSTWSLIRQQLLDGSGGRPIVAISPDGQSLVSAMMNIKRWSTIDGAYIEDVSAHTGQVNGVAFSSDGRIFASGASTGTVDINKGPKLFWANDGSAPRTLPVLPSVNDQRIQALSFSQNGYWIAAASSSLSIYVWNPNTQEGVVQLAAPGSPTQVAFTPNSTTLVANSVSSSSTGLRLWRTDNWAVRNITTGSGTPVNAFVISQDSSVITAAVASNLKTYDVQTGALIRTSASTFTASAISMTYSPDGQYIASGHGLGTVRLWRASDLALLKTIQAHGHNVEAVAFSPDGAVLLTAGADPQLRIWSVPSLDLLKYYDEETGLGGVSNAHIFSIAFSPNGQYFGYGRIDGTAVVAYNPFFVPLQISDATVSDLTATTATISWKTNLLSDSAVDFGPTTNYGGTVSSGAMVTSHSMFLDNLSPHSTLHFQVRSATSDARNAKAGDFTLHTLNRAPVANEQTISTTAGTPIAITLTGSDPDGDPLTYTVTAVPANGTLSGDAPNLTYTPNPGFSGSDSFRFKVTDSAGDSSAEATVSITVGAGIPRLSVRVGLSRDIGTNDIIAAITVSNTGSADAAAFQLTSATLSNLGTGASGGGTPLPQSLGTIPAGGSASGVLRFSSDIGLSGQAGVVQVRGTFAGGSLSAGLRVRFP